DRNVQADPEPTARLSTEMTRPILVFGNKVVLELKFTNRFPDWFKELVRVFGLMQCGAAKYVDGVANLGEHVVTRAFAFDVRPPGSNINRSDNAGKEPGVITAVSGQLVK